MNNWNRWAMGIISTVIAALLGLSTITVRAQSAAIEELKVKQAVTEERWIVVQRDLAEIKTKLDRIEGRLR